MQQLVEWGQPFETAEQIVAELASNAVLHGRLPGRSFRLTLSMLGEGTLRIDVADPSPEWSPRTPGQQPEAESGRGLLIVEALACRWGVDFSFTPQKSVWAEVSL